MSSRRAPEVPDDLPAPLLASGRTTIAPDSLRSRTNGVYTASPDVSDQGEDDEERSALAAAPNGVHEHGRGGGDHQSMLWWGYGLLGTSTVSLLVGLWSLSIGPLCQPTGLPVLDLLVDDVYYKYLVVLLVPVTVCFVIINWWGLKIFRHA